MSVAGVGLVDLSGNFDSIGQWNFKNERKVSVRCPLGGVYTTCQKFKNTLISTQIWFLLLFLTSFLKDESLFT